jgi:hypothetical protein
MPPELAHLERKDFEGSSEHINGLNYLRKEYGEARVIKFPGTLKDMGKIKKTNEYEIVFFSNSIYHSPPDLFLCNQVV